MHRRKFLGQASQLAAATVVSLGSHCWFARSQAASSRRERLIVVFLRGGVDGLSLIVPYRENAYYEARPTIAIPPPGQAEGAIALNGQFGLHPALSMLFPMWQQRQFAIVQGCGLPQATRSHFEAQRLMESGMPEITQGTDGWMNRLLTSLTTEANPIQAVNVGNTMPQILAGARSVANLAPQRAAAQPSLDQLKIAQEFAQLYDLDTPLGKAYKEALAARQALQMALQSEMTQADNGAPHPQGFARDAQRLARIMTQDRRVQLAFFGLGGWDTHVNQGATQGQLARQFHQLGQGLFALKTGLGEEFNNTTIVVMSEFGRTVHENGNRGTDHGQANVMLLLGGGIPGGQVYGTWPGSAIAQLHNQRELTTTVDFRDVITTVLERQMKLNDRQRSQVFFQYEPSSRIW